MLPKVEVAARFQPKAKPEGTVKATIQVQQIEGIQDFEAIQKKHGLKLFHARARASPEICFRFQKHTCFDAGKCGREHICIGCAKAGSRTMIPVAWNLLLERCPQFLKMCWNVLLSLSK